MSTIGGGGSGGSEYDRVSQLIAFVQQPEYHDRVKELRELEVSSKDALDKATVATAQAKAASESLVTQQQKLATDTAAFHDERDAHRADMQRREVAIQANLDRFEKLQQQVTADSEALDRRQAQWEAAKKAKEKELADREAGIKAQEAALVKQQQAFNRRVVAVKKAMSDE